ncbi:CEI_1a_G0036060.mRNA.1.CDS.1 [Saccharomyces cerevisiae]|nr:AMH_1a_G0036210.mRNA.1.CDS.1 [Saccharomyces cerevisiae]CAI4684259.1 CEI_1a_G0036060.mRNA.1.CDS.1 [Saccharomyces cerevisiae]CAI6833827.1 AMH_1a_G0036210.mRNA.1.CDS.1 [Saccharomyces cerevisiae]CAI7423967.1 CEI_1a_G0036060.mRNA.1.CDS.1 [Saccharomyces cerevisiae]
MNQAIDFAQASIDSYKKHGILEDVIHDTSFQPSGILAVEYSSSAPVAMGNTLPTEKTHSKPQFQFTFNKQMQKSVPQANAYVPQDDDLFTLVMTDPDAPSKTDHKWSEFCHLVECDLKLLNEATHETSGATEFFASEFNTKGSNTLIEYMGPAPPKGSGPHRYVFLLYKQPKGVDSSKFSKIKDRPNWGYGTPATGVGEWAKENNLQLVASNFFYAETK